MAKLSGYGGSFDIGANTMAEITDWSISAAGREVTGLAKGETVELTAVAASKYTAQISGYLDPTDTNGQVAAFAPGTTLSTLKFHIAGSATNDYHYTCSSGVVVNFDWASPMDYATFSCTVALNAVPAQAQTA